MNDFLQIHNNDKYFKYSKYDWDTRFVQQILWHEQQDLRRRTIKRWQWGIFSTVIDEREDVLGGISVRSILGGERRRWKEKVV
jgi:hypothetical protein